MLYKSKLLTLRTIGYSWIHSWYIVMSIVYGPKWPFYSCLDYIGLFGKARPWGRAGGATAQGPHLPGPIYNNIILILY